MLVTAEAGRGKSTLLARWCGAVERDGHVGSGDGTRGVVFVPISARYELSREGTVLAAAVTRLAELHKTAVFPSPVDGWRSALAALLSTPPPDDSHLLVIFDGLDETSGWSVGPSLLPAEPAEGVKVLASARLTATSPTAEEWLSRLGWPARTTPTIELGLLDEEGTREVLLGMGPPVAALADDADIVGRLHRVSGGDQLVLGLYAEHMWAEPSSDVDRLRRWLDEGEPGLAGFMARWWQDQERIWQGDLAGQAPAVALVLNLLACSLGSLERGELLQLARRRRALSGDELDRTLAVLDRFVVQRNRSAYAISHPRLASYRVDTLRASNELEPIERTFLEWGEDTLEALRSAQLEPREVSPYLLRHFSAHLEQAKASPSALLELTDPNWQAAWSKALDEVDGFIADVDRAWAAAASADAAAIADGLPARSAADEVWCTYVRAAASQAFDLVSGGLAGALVRYGVWSDRRAVKVCSRAEKANDRASELAELAPALGREGLELAVTEVLRLEEAYEPIRASAVAAVVDRAGEEGLLDSAHRILRDLAPGHARAAGHLALLQHVEGPERDSILEKLVADVTAPDNEEPRETLEPITRQLDRETATRVFGDSPAEFVKRRVSEEWERRALDTSAQAHAQALTLASSACWMEPDELALEVKNALEALESHPTYIDEAVTALAPFLNEGEWSRARDIVDDIPNTHNKWRALIGLLPSAPNSERETLSRRIVNALPEFTEHPFRPVKLKEALALLVQYAPADPILDVIQAVDPASWEKGDLLAVIAPHLDEPATGRALSIAEGVRRETRTDALRPVLARWASFGKTQAIEALELASSSRDADELRVLALILSDVPPGRTPFSEVEAISDPSLRYAAAASVAGTMSPLTAKAMREFLLALDPIGAGGSLTDSLTVSLFEVLARDLPADELLSAVPIIQAIAEQFVHDRKDAILTAYFARISAAAGPVRAIEVGAEMSRESYPFPLEWALAGATHELGRADDAERTRVQELTDEQKTNPVVAAALLHMLDEDARPAAWASVLEQLGPHDTQLHPQETARVLSTVPDELYEWTADVLTPSALLDGEENIFSELTTWVGQMIELVRALDAGRARRLLACSTRSDSGTTRSEMRAAVSVRLMRLGEYEEALEILRYASSEHRGAAFQEMIDVAPVEQMARLAEEALESVDHEYWRGWRAVILTALSRRVPELPRRDLLQLLCQWHSARPTLGQVFVDLTAYVPVVRALAGEAAVDVLRARLMDTTIQAQWIDESSPITRDTFTIYRE
jgi:hypothetical protein